MLITISGTLAVVLGLRELNRIRRAVESNHKQHEKLIEMFQPWFEKPKKKNVKK